MNPIRADKEMFGTGGRPEGRAWPLSYPELCSALLSGISRSAKNSSLYSLAHPVVTESVAGTYSTLRELLRSSGGRLTLSFVNDSWMFNDTQVPAVTQDSHSLALLLRGRGALSITFLEGVTSFELGAFCELLGTPARGQAQGGLSDLMAQKGIKGIIAESVRYVKEVRPSPAEPVRTESAPRPRADVPAPGTTSRPRAPVSPAVQPAVSPAVQPARSSGAGPGPGGGAGSGSGAGRGLGELMTRLVESAVKDPAERDRVYEEALRMIKETLEEQVRRSTGKLEREKDQAVSTRNRTEQVLARVAEGKVIVDKEGKILMMNPAAEEISGKRLSEVAGKHISEHLKPGEHFLTISDDMDLSGAAPVTGQVSVAGDALVGQALRRSMALLEDDEGRVVGAYVTLPELTKFKEAQRLQEEFLSKVTHDLQSPLASIVSALEMLTDTAGIKLDDSENNFLSISVRNSRRLTDMIRGILDFSKLQAGKLSVRPEPVDLGPILDEAGEGLMPWARTKGITLMVRKPAREIRVSADAQRVVQIVTNLVSNAIKSTPAGGTVLVAASLAANPDPCAIIGIRDTGRGISKADMGRIFEKFVQLEGEGHREGVGLGLSIVKELVTLHKGRLWAESEPGKGATFYFTLPLADNPDLAV
jgi:signal transduction histidine kinase